MAPLTKLSSVKLKFEWSSDAHSAFCKLDTLFSTAPLLVHLDPELQFAVEVDVSDSGVGAVLSQCSPTDQKLHPCAFILAVSRLNGIPQDNVSDRGPQFASQVWRAFYQAVGASASLSPGCHPLTNGQIEQANQDLASFLRCVVSPPSLRVNSSVMGRIRPRLTGQLCHRYVTLHGDERLSASLCSHSRSPT